MLRLKSTSFFFKYEDAFSKCAAWSQVFSHDTISIFKFFHSWREQKTEARATKTHQWSLERWTLTFQDFFFFTSSHIDCLCPLYPSYLELFPGRGAPGLPLPSAPLTTLRGLCRDELALLVTSCSILFLMAISRPFWKDSIWLISFRLHSKFRQIHFSSKIVTFESNIITIFTWGEKKQKMFTQKFNVNFTKSV